MHILKIREGGGAPPSPTLDPRLQYWVSRGIYTCTIIGKYMCVVGEMVGWGTGGLEIENGNGWTAG